MNIVALLGATISPYLFFWQSSLEVERKIDEGKVRDGERQGKVMRVAAKGGSDRDVLRMRVDVISGMLFSGLVGWAILLAMASTLHRQGIFTVDSAAQAALILKPLAGGLAYLLFALGMVGAGLLALPVMAGGIAYAVAETFNLPEGLHRKPREAPIFYGILVIATSIGLAANLIGVNPIQALYYASVTNGIAAPLLLGIVVTIGSNRKIMRDKVNGRWSTMLGWSATTVMATVGIATLVAMALGR
jgi:Mn2+/Fe2+ NRAMP family transporter